MTGRAIDFGDACVVLELEARVDPRVNDGCLAIATQLARSDLPGIRDIITTYHTVAVHIDPLIADRDAVADVLNRLAQSAEGLDVSDRVRHEIPVCYADEFGPDLEDVARFAKCTVDDVVRRHSETTYRVYMIGFLPGFAYLGKVDDRIAMGRHETPRMRVVAGSVAIAGGQTGIYPMDSPGGWRVIGRTWVRPFSLQRPEPSLFRVGDTVRFVPVGRSVYLEADHESGDAVR